MDAGKLRGSLDFALVDFSEIANVLGDGRMDELRRLRDERDQPCPILPAETMSRDTVDEIPPCVGLTKSKQELRERRLPGAGGPDDADRLAGLHVERNPRQCLRPRPFAVRVRHVFERRA